MSSVVCPLCKRSSNQENQEPKPATRLCAECQAMIANVMPQSSRVQPNRNTTFSTLAPVAVSTLPVPTTTPDVKPSRFQNLAESFPTDSVLPKPSQSFDSKSDDKQYDHFALADSPIQPSDSEVMEAMPLARTIEAAENCAIESSTETQSVIETSTNDIEIDEDSLAPHNLNSKRTARKVSGPLIEDVPPSWDNTMDDYPLLVPKSRSKTYSPRQIAIISVLILAGLAAGFFLFKTLFKPTTETATEQAQAKPQAQVAQNQAPEPTSVAPAEAEKPVTASQEKAAQNPSFESKEKTAPTAPDAASVEGQGNLTLQAALLSSPTSANDFVDKLKKAGIPAYVSPSGSKYKILIGRFPTEAAAQHYIPVAQERAKSVGVTLTDLYVSKE